MENSIFLLLFLIGLGLILYPIVSSKVEDWSHSKAIADYRSQVAENAAQLEQKKEEARAYNGQLAQPAAQADGQEPTAGYYSLLSFQDVMGYLEIPEIGVNLPIYHGTSDLVLEMGVGHLESSSLPIGGESTHAVLMGHRGLPSSTLFNKLPKLKEGAQFYIHMLDETLAYEVDQIKVIEPDNLADLQIVPGKDYVTLMTCTPYMINSHRLLVRGHRIATPPPGEEAAPAAAVQVQPQAEQAVWPWILAAIAAACLLALCIILLAKKKKGRGRAHDSIAKKRLRIAAALLFLLGLGLVCYPVLSNWARNMLQSIDSQRYGSEQSQPNPSADASLEELYRQMQAYNKRLYSEGQKLTDPFAYEQPSFDLKQFGLPDNIVGYLSIPKLGVQLPVYLGASRENLRKGAAHLSQTSLPIGGADTNAVIAAHRGLASQEMFLHIDQLEEGDEVTLSNFREVLHYRVTDTEIIAPDEMQKVLIQPGRDLLTLVTCHPYPTTRQRYLVYCERVKEPAAK